MLLSRAILIDCDLTFNYHKQKGGENMKGDLEYYLNLIVPQPLESDEYVKMLLIHAETEIATKKFVQTFEEIEEIIDKYK